MGLYTYNSESIPKTDRIPRMIERMYAKMPELESARAILITESYKETENEPIIAKSNVASRATRKSFFFIVQALLSLSYRMSTSSG
jgi:formate C-acetyltransferase